MESVLGGTIVARSSAAGHSARAIVRLSGPDAIAALASLAGEAGAPSSRGAHRIRMRLPAGGAPCECPALALVMPAPGSFTGEDCVELVVPGNPSLVDAVVAALMRTAGVSAAAPGAFMARAHAAGRVALADAERIALEIGAMHARDLEAARHIRSNPLVEAARSASAGLADLLARVEAGIDFTDSEDVVAISQADLCARARAIRGGIMRWIEGSVPLESMRSLPVVALRGPPNAGKSSLFNALLGRVRTVASPVPGTTRDAIAEEVELPALRADQPALRAVLMDTPGIEDPRGAIDALMQEQARLADHADVVLLCEPLSSMGGPPPATAGHVIRVATRADEATLDRRADLPGALRTSAVTGEGIRELAASVASALAAQGSVTSSVQRIGALARHREAMAQAADWLARGIDAAGEGRGPAIARPELVADALRGALDALGEVTGEVTPDDVLGLVFSRFCIGK